jgi:hypothetical protein
VPSKRLAVVAALALAARPPLTIAQERAVKVRDDLRQFEDDPRWIYNDLNAARAAAEESGRPLLAVIRCIP